MRNLPNPAHKWIPAYSRLNEDKTLSCLECSASIDSCNCIWSAIRDLQSKSDKIVNQENIFIRLNKIEIDLSDCDERINDLEKIEAEPRLIRLEVAFNKSDAFEVDGEYAINDLRDRVDKLEECIKRITEDNMKSTKQPHKCPICYGEGTIYKQDFPSIHDKLHGWITDGMGMGCKGCITCEGKGIVWG